MLSTCVRSPVAEMEGKNIIVMTPHALFQGSLGGPNAGLASDFTMDFVHHHGVSADVIIGATLGGAVATIARPRHEIFREDPSVEFPRQIPIEQLSKVREPVVGHGHSNPPQVVLGLKVLNQFPAHKNFAIRRNSLVAANKRIAKAA